MWQNRNSLGENRGGIRSILGRDWRKICVWSQQTQIAGDAQVPGCSLPRCWGKRISHTIGMFRFCVPYGMKFRRVSGFEDDIHDSLTVHSHSETSELLIFTANATWGPVKARPEWFPLSNPPPGGVCAPMAMLRGRRSGFPLDTEWTILADARIPHGLRRIPGCL
jgi:hypothetical protein